MKRPVAWISVIALFLVGILAGVLSTHLYYAHLLMRPGGPPAMGAHRFAARLERELGLTAEQKQRIDAIMRESHRESEELRSEMAPRVRAHMRKTHERILAVLTPEQQERFDRLRHRHRRRAEQFFLGPPHRRPH